MTQWQGHYENNHPRAHYMELQTNTNMSHKCLEMFLPLGYPTPKNLSLRKELNFQVNVSM